MSTTSLMCLFIRDFKQQKWVESIHVTRKYSAFIFWKMKPIVFGPNSKIFYLLCYIFIWTLILYRRLLLSFIHLASPNQLLSAPYFFQMHNPSVSRWNSKFWCNFSVFLLFYIFYPPGHQACEIFHEFLFFPSSILVKTLPQIQHSPNYIQRNAVWENINRSCSHISWPNTLSHPSNWTTI